jgi:hypothetical protein
MNRGGLFLCSRGLEPERNAHRNADIRGVFGYPEFETQAQRLPLAQPIGHSKIQGSNLDVIAFLQRIPKLSFG